MRKKITEELKNEIIEFYKKSPVKMETVAEHFGLCSVTVSRILKNIKRYSKTSIFNPSLDENYFDDINDERKAYWVGLIIADGNIFNPINSKHHGQKWVSITLKEEDEYLLEEFRQDIGLTAKIGKDGRGSSYVAVRSDHMANALASYGITERKSFNTKFPFNIDSAYYRHVIRGIIDGDGSIQAHPYDTKTGKHKFRHGIFCCGTHRLMTEMVDVIDKFVCLCSKPSVYDYKNRLLSEFKVTKKEDVKKFGEWLYNDATIFLKRKYFKYGLILEHYGLK